MDPAPTSSTRPTDPRGIAGAGTAAYDGGVQGVRFSSELWTKPKAVLPAMAVALALMPAAAMAQDNGNPPQRIGNIWDTLPHQPTEGDVTAKEHQSGVAPSNAQNRNTDKDLMRLDQQLLTKEKTNPPPPMPTIPPPGTN